MPEWEVQESQLARNGRHSPMAWLGANSSRVHKMKVKNFTERLYIVIGIHFNAWMVTQSGKNYKKMTPKMTLLFKCIWKIVKKIFLTICCIVNGRTRELARNGGYYRLGICSESGRVNSDTALQIWSLLTSLFLSCWVATVHDYAQFRKIFLCKKTGACRHTFKDLFIDTFWETISNQA